MSAAAERRLSAARTALVLDHPFFGALALRLQSREAPEKTETMATDGRAIFYAPDFIAKVTDAELVGLVAHECMHPAMQHHTRRGGREARRWNEAADYAINPILKDAGLALPEGALIDPAYAGLSAEQIYERLPQPPQGDGQGGDPNEPGGNPLADLPGAVIDAPDPAQDAAEWQVAAIQAARAAKMMGRLPGSLAQAIGETLKPRVDWRSLLRRFVQNCASADYSWRRPNPRYIAGGIYLPEIRSEAMPPLVVILDTSGSTRAAQAGFLAEVDAIAEECRPEAVYLIECDAAIHRITRIERGEGVALPDGKLLGQGGTDFRPAFARIEDEQLSPACAIYLTDGEGSYPHEPPNYPTIWAMTTDIEAPWGETIKISEASI